MWNFESWTGRDLNSPAETRARTYLCKERSLGLCLLMLLAGAKKGYLALDLDWSVNLVEGCFRFSWPELGRDRGSVVFWL